MSAVPVDLAAVATVRSARVATRRRRRTVLPALAVVVFGLFAVDVLLGAYTVTIADFVRIAAGADIPGATFIVWENKLPRAAIGLLIGVALGVAGAIFQTMLRNPLASPDIIGISAGASTSAVFAIVVLGAAGTSVSGFALGGALVVALGIYLLARRGGVAGQRLVLVGIGCAAMLHAGTSYLLTRSDIHNAAKAMVWLNGSLNNSSWPRFTTLAVALALLLPVAAALSRGLRGLELGDELATSLGVGVERTRLGLLLVAACLAAAATAAAGPVAFIAFLSAPIARRLLAGAVSLTAAALVGASIVLGAEYVAANLVRGTALPVGVVTGALGAPFLIWLLMAANRVGRGG